MTRTTITAREGEEEEQTNTVHIWKLIEVIAASCSQSQICCMIFLMVAIGALWYGKYHRNKPKYQMLIKSEMFSTVFFDVNNLQRATKFELS